MTQHVYRIMLLYPESRRQEIEDWYAIEFHGQGTLLTPIGTKNGQQWYATSFVATKSDVEKWLARFGSELQTQIPIGFVELPREIQRQWIDGMKSAAMQALGIYMDACWNDLGEWLDIGQAINALGIVRPQPEF